MTSQRQRARARREAEHYAAKLAEAPNAAARAAVVFDRLRARIADLPVRDRDPAWGGVIAGLEACTARLPTPDERTER